LNVEVPRGVATALGAADATTSGELPRVLDAWAAQLIGLALEHGVSTFLVMSDDEAVLRVFAQDVAPAVRRAVGERRTAEGVVVGVPVPARLRERRRHGIDYDAVPEGLTAVEPGEARFADVRTNYLRGGDPGLVLLPRDPAEVGEALRFARAQDVPLGVRSGGHGISGRSTNDGGIVLDLSRFDSVELLDPATRLVRVGAGARWADVAAALAPHGLAVTSGDSGGVGVGGLATAGGIGWYSRKHGLTIDRVRAVDAVLADGTPVRASATENSELFWGMRGAGGSLAVATSFEIEAHPGGPLGFAQLVFDASDVAGFLERWGAVVEAASRDVTSFLLMGRPQRGQPVVAQVMVAVDSADPDTVIGHLNPFAQLAPLLDQSVRIAPYGSIIVPPFGPHRGEGEPVARSSLVEHVSREVALAAERVIVGGASYFFQIRAVGGAVADVDPAATAYAHRSASFSVTAMGASRARIDPVWDQLHRHALGLYLSFETDPRPERLLDTFPPATLARLRALKSAVDPTGLFRDNFPLVP
ncbi:MAG: FAD-binding oxidoreductase, partial [Actinomycetales bacterium]|nr:FAD-binding oxidoreductase [Actinomycetales bacterium]